jgi:hypothetical protein
MMGMLTLWIVPYCDPPCSDCVRVAFASMSLLHLTEYLPSPLSQRGRRCLGGSCWKEVTVSRQRGVLMRIIMFLLHFIFTQYLSSSMRCPNASVSCRMEECGVGGGEVLEKRSDVQSSARCSDGKRQFFPVRQTTITRRLFAGFSMTPLGLDDDTPHKWTKSTRKMYFLACLVALCWTQDEILTDVLSTRS